MGTAPAAAVGDAAGGRNGQPVAIFSAFSDLGAIIGPLAAGALVDAVSFPAAFGSAVVLMLAASVYALRMPRAVHSTLLNSQVWPEVVRREEGEHDEP
jgi:MFS family permease